MKVVLPAFGGHIYQGPWPLVPLQYVAQVQAGDGISADRIREAGPVPVFGGNGVRGYTERHNVEGARILVGRQGALCGNVHLTRGRIWATEHALVVTPERDTDASWLRYALEAADLGRLSIASAQPGITRTAVQTDLLPFAPPAFREGMSDYLDRETAEIDAMDADLDRLVDTLRDRRQTVVGTPWSRARPPDWDVRPLWSMFRREKILGFTEEPMVSVFRQHGVVFKEDHDNLNVTAQNRSIYQLVEPGWLVVNRMKAWQGSVGVSSIRGITSGHYICFRPIHDEDNRYLNWMFRSPHYKEWFAAHSRGVRPGQAEIDNSYLDGMPIVVPPRDEQGRIVAELDEQTAQIDDMIADAERLKRLLAERRSTLITDVVTGKKEVPA